MGMTPSENKGQFSDPNIVPLIDVLLGAGIEHIALMTSGGNTQKSAL